MDMSEEQSRLHTRPTLLARVRDPRDAVAWREFTEIYAPLVYGYCRRRGLGEHDAADVGQMVFARVSRAIQSFEYDPSRGRFRDWLGTVIRREIQRFLAKRQREVRGAGGSSDQAIKNIPDEGEDPLWEEEFNRHIFQTAQERSRPHFEAQTWRAFELLWLENLPAAEVASQLDLAIDRVYEAKARVLRRLREEVLLLAEENPLFRD
jgi:RNA polymerase sigma-70 factor (ECF subfamily)